MKEYTVNGLGGGVFSVYIDGDRRITQMIWTVGELICFCAALNSGGFSPANDWTALL